MKQLYQAHAGPRRRRRPWPVPPWPLPISCCRHRRLFIGHPMEHPPGLRIKYKFHFLAIIILLSDRLFHCSLATNIISHFLHQPKLNTPLQWVPPPWSLFPCCLFLTIFIGRATLPASTFPSSCYFRFMPTPTHSSPSILWLPSSTTFVSPWSGTSLNDIDFFPSPLFAFVRLAIASTFSSTFVSAQSLNRSSQKGGGYIKRGETIATPVPPATICPRLTQTVLPPQLDRSPLVQLRPSHLPLFGFIGTSSPPAMVAMAAMTVTHCC